ncbi:MAG TPA: exonuclease domain-containing protein, partial [Dehalococcoidia bacterium]|nr:exonuclease domain-containing protein [Dehalococcoidia bacterium]
MDVYVALDLETTGTDLQRDAIIEIGAVKFNHEGVLDKFVTFVNPQRPIPAPITDLTGISDEDVADAPPIGALREAVARFLGDHPLVGHNISAFDRVFLETHHIPYGDVIFDTHELAATFLPNIGEYSLRSLLGHFGIENSRPHRALPDALAAMALFEALRRHTSGLPGPLLNQLERWLAACPWTGSLFLASALRMSQEDGGPSRPARAAFVAGEVLEPAASPVLVSAREAVAVLDAAAEQEGLIAGFERRPEQIRMLEAVTEAFNNGQQLLVEAGTGTGKSLAYLVPAAIYALRNGSRVVVSTNTINLQQQLARKDIPTLQSLLEAAGPDTQLRAAVLKGKGNYLCLRRFHALQPTPPLPEDEARFLTRLAIWASKTETGDRAELRLRAREQPLWRRISAEEANCNSDNCPFVVEGSCFLVRARRRAEAAHLLVVNHALLLADVAIGGRLLPPYEHLVIDEAHHLEEEATRQFGFQAGEAELIEFLEGCQRLAAEIRAESRRTAAALSRGASLVGAARALEEAVERARRHLQQLAAVARSF